MLDLDVALRALVDKRGSDLHLKVGQPPVIRVDGRLRNAGDTPVTAKDTARIAKQIIPARHSAELEEQGGVDFAHAVEGVGRFRVNVFNQRGIVGVVLRRVMPAPPHIDALHLPPIIKRLAEEPRGLILVTGPTGSGKTTTCAAMINHINTSRRCNIVTLEDPIEILHTDKKALVNQREVGSDTKTFAAGLRHAMRQDPDVIFLGEMRDPESVWAALAASETGHLVISTLHTTDATETINRIIEFFGPERQRQIRHSLAAALRGVVSQRLLLRSDGKGRIPAIEVLVCTGRISECIVNPEDTRQIPSIMAEGDYYGMQTFDQSLLELLLNDQVSPEDAMLAASSPHDLKLALRKAGAA